MRPFFLISSLLGLLFFASTQTVFAAIGYGGGSSGGGGTSNSSYGSGPIPLAVDVFAPIPTPTPTSTPSVIMLPPAPTSTPELIPQPPPEPIPAPPPPPLVFLDPWDVTGLIQRFNLTLNPDAYHLVLLQVADDAQAFGVTLNADQARSMANFIVYGISDTTIRFGPRERRAILRDYLETVGRADVRYDDIERIATGQIPIHRNLALERARAAMTLAAFRRIYGHAPVFQNAQENLAWNTLMYRIRFPRDLVRERNGVIAFRTLWNRNPTSPFDWSVVRVLGYLR